ncbi:MAG TPA: hypothetical protein VN684_07480 [Terriglobales bacterium]|jgi:hypothetical protein|nr:hypothetical protein [Terriglobales bacterium]
MSIVHLLIHHTRDLITGHFLLVWLCLLAVIALCGLWLSGYAEEVFSVPSTPDYSGRRNQLFASFQGFDAIAAILFLLFAAFYIFLIFYKEDFAYYDDDMMTDYSVAGKNLLPPLWPGSGRFYPLADQEFNLLKRFTRSPMGYHLLVAAQLVVFLVVLFLVLKKFAPRYRFLIMGAVIIAPSFVIPFSGFVYPERNVLFWLAILLLCLQGHARNNGRIYFVGCLVATHFVLYYKETAVLFIAGYAVSHLVLKRFLMVRAARRSWQVFARQNLIPLGMLAVATIYVALFVIALFPRRSFGYVASHSEALGSVLRLYLHIDWLLLLLLIVVVVRLTAFVLSDGPLDEIWDPAAVGALAYGAGILMVHLYSGYYMAPVDFIAVLYLSNMTLEWLRSPVKVRRFAVAVVAVCVLFQSLVFSAARIVERKGVIATKSQMANFLKAQLPTAAGQSVTLFFPYADGYRLMEIASYLKYKGFNVEEQQNGASSRGAVIRMESPLNLKENLCVDYKEYVCSHEQQPEPGAFIVVLPDDDVSGREIRNASNNVVPILTTNGCAFCDKKIHWFQFTHPVLVSDPEGPLPDRWLKLEIFKKPA